MRAVPLGPSVEPPMGPRNAGLCWVVADACGRCHWDGRMRAVLLGASVEPPMGPRNAVLGG
eukprot:5262701-Pyramimonas_sp.AAC.1